MHELNFDKRLRKIMKEKQLNQLQLAKLINIRQSQISNWLAGKSAPGYHSLRLLCRKLEIDANELIK